MGGFTIDGCGAADSYYPLRPVGTFYCQSCRSEQQFSLMELKRKIKVFYIPTVSLYSKYAVVCEKCKVGHYVEENVKNDLLAGRTAVTAVTEEGLKFSSDARIESDRRPAENRTSVTEPSVTEPADAETSVAETTVTETTAAEATAAETTAAETTAAETTAAETTVTESADTESAADREPETSAPEGGKKEPVAGGRHVGRVEIRVPATKKCPYCGFSYVGEPETCVICGEELPRSPEAAP